MITWPTLKRLHHLERERTKSLQHIAALLDDLWETRNRLAASMKNEARLLEKLTRLQSEREIEDLLREAAE